MLQQNGILTNYSFKVQRGITETKPSKKQKKKLETSTFTTLVLDTLSDIFVVWHCIHTHVQGLYRMSLGPWSAKISRSRCLWKHPFNKSSSAEERDGLNPIQKQISTRILSVCVFFIQVAHRCIWSLWKLAGPPSWDHLVASHSNYCQLEWSAQGWNISTRMWELQRFHPHSCGRAPPPQTEGWEKESQQPSTSILEQMCFSSDCLRKNDICWALPKHCKSW